MRPVRAISRKDQEAEGGATASSGQESAMPKKRHESRSLYWIVLATALLQLLGALLELFREAFNFAG